MTEKPNFEKWVEENTGKSFLGACIKVIKKWAKYDERSEEEKNQIDKELKNIYDLIEVTEDEQRAYFIKKFRDEEKPEKAEELFIEAKKVQKNQLAKEEKKGYEALLEGEESQKQYLDLGITSDEGWYYGKKLNGGQDAIITDDKKIYQNTLVEIKIRQEIITKGENQIMPYVDYDASIGDIAPIWSNESIKQFLNGKHIVKEEFFQKIKKILLHYMDYGDKEIYADIQACWIIGTYCYPLFYWFPHLFYYAPSGSGKSKNAFITRSMSFRGFDLGASAGVTPAQIFRTLEGNRGTFVVDEFERREKSESQQLVNQILNASASADSYVIRLEPTEKAGKSYQAKKFHIFCPKIVCNITGINDTSLSRFIVLSLLKTLGNKGNLKPYTKEAKEEFRKIRDDCHILVMQNWKEIREIYANLKVDLHNRIEDNWRPILSVAKCINQEIYDKILNYIKEKEADLQVDTGSKDEDLFAVIWENLGEEQNTVTPKQISQWLENDEEADWITRYKGLSTWVGKRLTKYQVKSTRKGKGMEYDLGKKEALEIIERYFPNLYTSIKNKNPTLPTQATQHTFPTQATQHTLNIIEKEAKPSRGAVEQESDVGSVGNVAFPRHVDKLKEIFGIKKECDAYLIDRQFPKGVIDNWMKEGTLSEPTKGRYVLNG